MLDQFDEADDEHEASATDDVEFDEDLKNFQIALEKHPSVSKQEKLKPNVSSDWVNSMKRPSSQ